MSDPSRFDAPERTRAPSERPCRECGEPFEPRTPNQLHCGRECREVHRYLRAHPDASEAERLLLAAVYGPYRRFDIESGDREYGERRERERREAEISRARETLARYGVCEEGGEGTL